MPASSTLEEKQNLVEESTARSLRLYDEQLKALLEPQRNGSVVAIHPESSAYTVASTAAEARRALRLRQPSGFILTRTIGPETRQALARRILAARREAPRVP